MNTRTKRTSVRSKGRASASAADKGRLDEVVFGYDNDGRPLFYYPEEGEAAREGEYLGRRYADCPDLPSGHRPILGLVRGGEGLWIDKPGEWADAEAPPNGWVAYTKAGVRLLIERARVGDLLVPLGSTDLASMLGSTA